MKLQLPATMRAAVIHETGGVDKICVEELPLPQPGATDVLVRMEASAVNHVDLFVRSGAWKTALPMPFVIGRDLVGTVVDKGPGVTGFAVGGRVWSNSLGHHGRQGSWSEYAAVEAARLYPLPGGVDAREAAVVLHGAATAWLALFRHACLSIGETVLIEGAGGAVGSAAVQMAGLAGASVVATASAGDAGWCRDCGAGTVLDYHGDDLLKAVAAAAPGGLDLWWDCSGRQRVADRLALMAEGGRIIMTAGLGHQDVIFPAGEFYTRDLELHGFVISNASIPELAAAAAGINRMLASGRLRGRMGPVYTLAEAARAQQALAEGGLHGRRIVLVP